MMDTRTQILQKNFEAMRLNGFQGVRADKVVESLSITKGALYHYFATKQELGYAIVDEIIAPRFTAFWKPLENYGGNPIDYIKTKFHELSAICTENEAKLGCPLNNLMQEMSPLDDGFRERLQSIITQMQQSVAIGLKNGQKKKFVRKDIDPTKTALFLISSLEGAYGIAKTLQNRTAFETVMSGLVDYLETLRT
jgi:TetR/AcrR family transcriptional regulator, transcriptional repressor for nem operon